MWGFRIDEKIINLWSLVTAALSTTGLRVMIIKLIILLFWWNDFVPKRSHFPRLFPFFFNSLNPFDFQHHERNLASHHLDVGNGLRGDLFRLHHLSKLVKVLLLPLINQTNDFGHEICTDYWVITSAFSETFRLNLFYAGKFNRNHGREL